MRGHVYSIERGVLCRRPPNCTNEASAIINPMRKLGTTTMLRAGLQFHHERLAEHVTAYNGYGWNMPLTSIDQLIQAQAGIMSYLDIFWLLGILGLCIWPLALLLPRMPKGAAPAH
jgi:MFS transporter, DHA2 family, multidrug resistance protein